MDGQESDRCTDRQKYGQKDRQKNGLTREGQMEIKTN
jgi:hypothetical protein